LFGSYAKGLQTSKSDVDFVVEFKGNLFEFAGLNLELEKKIGKKVDLVTYDSLSEDIKALIVKS
jgi:predicted nucleotidyltransferase